MVEAIILTRAQPDGGESDEKMGEFALETEGDANSILTREWDLDYHNHAGEPGVFLFWFISFVLFSELGVFLALRTSNSLNIYTIEGDKLPNTETVITAAD